MATKLSILNDPPRVLEGPQLLHHLISWDEYAESCALDFTDHGNRQKYNYGELRSCFAPLVSRILEYLPKDNARNDQQHIVPLLIPQCPGLYVAQLAILNSGGAFCPLNLDSPTERLKFNIKDVNAKFVITTSQFKDKFAWENGPEVILVEEFPHPQPYQAKWALLREVMPEDLAYVMYTSGSSGTPKGVGVSHLAASQSLLAHELFLPKFERFLQFAAPSFDVSVFEIFFPLKRGKTLVGCEKTQLMDDLPGIITKLEIDAAELTPGVAGSLLEKRSHAPGLKLLLTIGEMLTKPVVAEFGGSETQKNLLYGMYGPTEAAIHCTVYPEMEADAKPGNIGVPFDNVSTFIASPSTSAEDAANLTFVPVGELGELVLGGPQLARGYLNREDQNKVAFVQFEGRNFYRTGDKARQLENGTIEILGRISSGQVKLRGQRLELGEVEDAIYKHPGVKTVTAAVVDNSLVVYTLVKEQSVKESDIIKVCANWLPKYMVPSEIVILQKFPYMPSGKIDKRKLNLDYQEKKKMEGESDSTELTETELAIKNVLEGVLGPFQFTTRLASAGLDSLMAIRVSTQLRALGYNVPTISVLRSETLASLSRLCEECKTMSTPPISDEVDAPMIDLLSALNGNAKDVESTMLCTPLQSAMLAETALDEKAYRNWIELELTNITDVNQVMSSLSILADHNPILRTGFVESEETNGYLQVVWSSFDGNSIEEVEQFIYAFDYSKDISLHRPVRLQISLHSMGTRVLVHIHHALYDAWSLELLLDDLNTILAGESLSYRPPFRVVVDAYQNGIINGDLWSSKDYWKDHLDNLEFRELPNFHPSARPARNLAVFNTKTSLSTSLIEAAARQLSVSPHAIFQTAHCLVLRAYLGTTDLCFGTVFSGRTLSIPSIEEVVGPCLATLPIRIDTSTIETLGQLVKELNTTNRKHLEYSTIPLKDIKSAAGAHPGQRLFDTLVIWQQTLHSYDYKREFVSLVDSVDSLEFNLTLEITPGIENIELKANYQQSLLPEDQVMVYLQQLEHVVKSIIESPSTHLDSCFEGLNPAGLSIENEKPDVSLKPYTLSSPVEEIASIDPHRVAIDFAQSIDEEQSSREQVSYWELNSRANRVGAYLMDQNILPDELICICMEKCIDLYATILATAKIGAGYLPQTPEVPLNRLRHILEEAKIRIVLAHSSSRSLLKSLSELKVVYVDEVDFTVFSHENIPPRSSSEHVSYCVYTSGSTGTPKGVLVTQGNLLSNLDVLEDLYPADHNARLLQQCSQAFDVSVFEIFFTWRIGGRLCAATKDVLFRDMELAIRSFGVTHLSMTPSVASLVDPSHVPSVQFLVTAGEAVTQKVKNLWQDNMLWQGYGPSETTNICTVKPRVTSHDAINNIGPPFKNTSAFVLSPRSDFALVPLGGEGEFVFGGSQVFRGYVDRRKEEGKIIEHPTFGRLYRSGDFGRMLSDGSLAFTGRKDDQVKIRGQRVELGEINSALLKNSAVRDCVTMIIDGSSGEQRLISFWAMAGDISLGVIVLRPDRIVISKLYKDLESNLPPYMIPSALIPISRLPSTAQGKVDKRSLIRIFTELDADYLNLASQATDASQDRTFSPIENNIAQAVAMIANMPIESIRADSSFFNLGIDSISAISLSRALRETYELKVEISEILKNSSVARLAAKITSRELGNGSSTSRPTEFLDFGFEESLRKEIIEKFENVGKIVQAIYPCTPLQEAMLSAGQSSSVQVYDNQVTFDIAGDIEKVNDCWQTMVQRHEILRTSFVATEIPRFPYVQVVLERHDLNYSHASTQKPDELDPPYSVTFGPKNLTVSMHHALYDGVALAVLYNEIETLYKGQSLPPPVSFEPFLKSMVSYDMKSCDEYWATMLRNCQVSRITQLSRKAGQAQSSTRQYFGRSPRALRWIEENIKKNSSSLLAVCHTIWSSILAELQDTQDVCFGNVVSGRADAIEGIERLVAPCFNTIPVRLNHTDKLSYLEAFRIFQDLNASSLPYQFTPLRRIQSKFSPDGSRLFDTLFILQQSSRPLDASIWSISKDTGAMDFPLVCEIVPNRSEDTLDIILHSYSSYFTDKDADRIVQLIQEKIEYALENPRRQLLSPALKEQIIAKADARSNKERIKQDTQKDSRTMSEEELRLRDVIANFTNIPADKIGREVSIFRLGLDSISIVQVATRLRKQGHVVSASDILAHPSIAQLGIFLLKEPETQIEEDAFDLRSFDASYRENICAKNSVNPENVEYIRPCTYVQQGMLATTLHSGGQEYINSIWFDIQPDLSIEALKDAWRTVCEIHEMLRTGFVSIDDPTFSFAMVTHRPGTVKFPWYNITEATEGSIKLENLLEEPWRLRYCSQNGKSLLCFTAHHALYDAQSIQMVLTDVAKILAAQFIPARPSTNLLLGAILQSSQNLQQEKEEFWKSAENKIVVNRFPDLTPLQVSHTTSAVQEILSQSSVSELEAECRNNGVTMQAAAQAAWARLLSAFIGEVSTTFGMTLSGRSVYEDGDSVSFPSIVTLPVRCDVFGTNAELLSRTMDHNAALHKHQFTPITSIQKWAGYPEGKIFDTLFAYQKLPESDGIKLPWTIAKEEASVDYAISMEVQPSSSGDVVLRLTFRQDVIPTEHADILLRQYDALLLDILKEPQHACDVAPAISHELIAVSPALEEILPAPVRLLHEFVTLGAKQLPKRIALEFATSLEPGNFKSKTWTYLELDQESNKVANFLLKRDVKPGEMIAICFDKCAEASFAIIGIMKAGCAYVALDPTAPDERSRFIVQDSNAKIILSRGNPAARLKAYMEKEVIAFDLPDMLKDFSGDEPKLSRDITPEDTSYCLYTSGTTGTPKGCLITHDNTVQFMLAFSRLFAGHWTDDSKYLQFASFHFDVSVMEQFWSWSVGICVASAPRDLIFEDIPGAINMLGITHIDLTPSLARLIHPSTVPTLCKGAFITGGEQLKQEILDVWGEHAVIYNGYGPTEVTIGCTMYPRVPKNGKPSNIGPAYINVGSFVLKPGTETPVLRGGLGELCVSGKLVGKGYLNRSDLTAERFPTLKAFNERVYRTGDLVRILHDGTFIFLGRADDQVKLRGQRLELSEINQVIKKSMDAIQEVVTLVLKHTAQQKEQLVTFYVFGSNTESGQDSTVISTMRETCKAKLPGYMVPTHFIPVNAIPLNANNKADSKQLATLYNNITTENLQKLSQQNQEDKPWTSAEMPIVEIIATALRTDSASVARGLNIFELGLDSISIISFSRALQTAGLENAKLSVVKSNPSLSTLVRALMQNEMPDQAKGKSHVAASQIIAAFAQRHIVGVSKELGIESKDVEAIAPCTPVQEGMIYRFLESDKPLYFNKFEFVLEEGVDSKNLLAAWDRIVARLEVLRTSFVATDDGFAQVVQRVSSQFDTEIIGYETVDKSAALKTPYSFDVLAEGEKRVAVLKIFHGLYDGNSLTMMLQRVVDEYRQLEMIEYGPSFIYSLPYGPLAQATGAEKFWTQHLQTWVEQPIPRKLEFTEDIVSTSVVDSLSGFDTLRKKLGVTPQAIIQAAWVSVLQSIISSNLTIGIVTSGRAIDYAGADKIIGPLFNTVPFHVEIESESTSASLVKSCHEYNMQMQDFQHTPLKNIQKWAPSKPGQQLFDTLFVFQRPEEGDEKYGNDIWRQVENGQIADYPLAFEATLSPDNTTLSLTIVAQGSVMADSSASGILKQVEESLLTMIESVGQNTVLGGATFNRNEKDVSEAKVSTQPTTSNDVFQWTNESKFIREEISTLVGVSEEHVLENSSIFELGLDSIDVIKLASRLKKRGVEIPVSAIIKSQTIEGMASHISTENIDSIIPIGKSLADMSNELKTYLQGLGQLSPDVEAVLPATPLQQSMINEMLKSDYERYFSVDGFKLNEGVDVERLVAAAMQVVEASPVLRTTFVAIDDPKSSVSYAQIVHKTLPQFKNAVTSLSLPQGQSFESFMEHFKHVAILYAKQRQELLQLQAISTDGANYLVIAISHALYDGTSLRNIHEDIQKAYHGTFAPRPDFMPFIEQVFQSTTDQAKKFWRTTLSELPLAKFPKKEHSDRNESTRLERRSRVPLVDIEGLCKSSRITLQTLGQTCWALVLSHLIGELDVVFGSVLSCRDTEEATLVNFPLMNTVAVRSVLHGTLNEMLKYMQELSDMTRQYQHFPLGMAQAYALASRKGGSDTTDTAMFDTLFIYQGRRRTAAGDSLYESVYGVADVELPVCVEMEIVDDAYLAWTTKCKSTFLNAAETEGILDTLDSVLSCLVSAPHRQTIISTTDGISISGLPSFQIADAKPKQDRAHVKNVANNKWSQTELGIRNALHEISDVPEENITKDTTIFHLGLDSILVLKLPALLKTYGIRISVSTILKDQTIYAMARSVGGDSSIVEAEPELDVDAIIEKAMEGLDVQSVLEGGKGDCGEVEYIMPATAGQTYMIRQWQSSRGAMFYQTFTYSLPTALDKPALEMAWQRLLARHEILRTGFIEARDTLVQVVFKDPKNEVVYHSGNGSVLTRKDKADLKLPPVNLVVEESEGKGIVELVIHHVLYDGISLPIIIEELQALYYNQSLASRAEVPSESFKDFVAQTITSSASMKDKWTMYLNDANETLFEIQTKKDMEEESNKSMLNRVEIYHPSNPTTDLKSRAQTIGVSIDALLLAGMSKVLTKNYQTPPESKNITFGIYLSNRAPCGTDLSSLSAPTLNLLPLRVDYPLVSSIEELARNIQRDLNIIGSREMVGVSLGEVYEWTRLKVDCFVNILKSSSAGANSPVVADETETWKAVRHLGTRSGVMEEKVNITMDGGKGKCDAYLPTVDIELRYNNVGSLDMGVFAPLEKLDLKGAKEMIECFLGLWR